MGLFDFDSSKPRVTRDEFHKKVRTELYGKGFNHKELDQLEGYFGGDLQESRSVDRGIDTAEIDRGVSWLREHKHDHTFSDSQINQIDETLRKHL